MVELRGWPSDAPADEREPSDDTVTTSESNRPFRSRFRGNSLLPEAHPVFVKKGKSYAPLGWQRYENNLLAVVGFLEFFNALDFPANVWNNYPVPRFVTALMGLGFALAMVGSGFAIWDGLLARRNIRFLLKEREYLKSWRERARKSKNVDSEILLGACMDVNFRELGWELADRFMMDLFMGVGLLVVGAGTLLAVYGEDSRLFHISNLLSGYVGNSFGATYVLVNATWSTFMWKRAHGQSNAIRRASGEIEYRIARRVETHSNRHKYYALVNGLSVFVGAIGGLMSATLWQGYVVSIPAIIGSAMANFFWRLKLGYTRDSVDQWIDVTTFDILERLKIVIGMHQSFKRRLEKSSETLELEWSTNVEAIHFLQENGLYRDFCAILLKDSAAAKKALGDLQHTVVVDPKRLLTADHRLVTRVAHECVRKVGKRRLQDEERYLLEFLGCYLVRKEMFGRAPIEDIQKTKSAQVASIDEKTSGVDDSPHQRRPTVEESQVENFTMILQTLLVPALWALLGYAKSSKPNVLFVLTDDQDWHMQSLDYMPLLQKYIIDKGTIYDRHYCSVAICCPSRVNIWTGRAAHNTNVTDLSLPFGGYPKFIQEGLNEAWLPVWLQALGYNTYYTGKLFNAHTVDNYNDPPVAGFNGSDFLLDPYTYEYYNAHMSRNHQKPVSYTGQYSPDVIAEKAYGFLDEALSHDDPWFLAVAPVAPHSDTKINNDGSVTFSLPKYAPRHAHLFNDYKIPRTANFNPDEPSGVSWIRNQPKLNDTVVEYHDEFQRARLRSLQSVDEMVETLVKKLTIAGQLNNTYIIYSTDNGFHISQHRLPPGKECPFETDIHIPLVIRGPGIPAGRRADVVSSHSDLTPTILKIAGSDRSDLDGRPIPLDEQSLEAPELGEHVNVEYWGRALPEGKYGWLGDNYPGVDGGPHNNTYKALRVVGEGYNILYTVWCTGEREFYDLSRDPDEMSNLLHETGVHLQAEYTLSGRPFMHVLNRLDSLLMVLKSCKAETCREPWKSLHPNTKVKTLSHALDLKFDDFYAEQPKVSFSSCQMGYLRHEEGPQDVNVWSDGRAFQPVKLNGQQATFDYGGHWTWWT
ncbi:Hypothetical protein R9X50_00512100 [Acrodontium crateriforme]|uniref:Sulfatase N-terminal domain-containing protein n=1 Tax=Acrodontium crateriforme TaxID=150365 RepID=A0AAQ3RB98_9PEZI|nr:Hypothetical protein R9X50_00512100 [Acrodontium crateriforme]